MTILSQNEQLEDERVAPVERRDQSRELGTASIESITVTTVEPQSSLFDSHFQAAESPGSSGLILVRASDVAPESVSWLWNYRLPRGKLVLLVGDPSAGKSFLSLDLASRLSRGSAWPDGGDAPLGASIIMADEDDVADTIRPRLDALGADAARINVVRGVHGGQTFSFAKHLAELERAVRSEQASLVVVDPLNAYLGGDVNSWNDAAVRQVLTPVATMASGTGAVVLGIMHLNKNMDLPALQRVMGSVAFTAVARVVLHAFKRAKGERILEVIKSNLAPTPPDLRYDLVEPGVIKWALSDSTSSPEEAQKGRTKAGQAAQFLQDQLASGPIAVSVVEERVNAAGISDSAFRRAKKALGVESVRDGSFTDGMWMMSLPTEPGASGGSSWTR